ncbi:hypothetical protein ACWFMH_18785 [Bacillus altitudinis]
MAGCIASPALRAAVPANPDTAWPAAPPAAPIAARSARLSSPTVGCKPEKTAPLTADSAYGAALANRPANDAPRPAGTAACAICPAMFPARPAPVSIKGLSRTRASAASRSARSPTPKRSSMALVATPLSPKRYGAASEERS